MSKKMKASENLQDQLREELKQSIMRDALELHEDMILSAIAAERDIEGMETISHEEAWVERN